MAFAKLAKRAAAGVVLIPIVLLVTYRGGLSFACFVALLAALGAWEFQRMVRARGIDVPGLVVMPGSALVVLAFYVGGIGSAAIVLTAVLLAVMVERLARAGVGGFVTDVSVAVTAVFYTGWLLGFFVLLRQFPGAAVAPGPAGPPDLGRSLVLLVLILAWSSDSGAYFVGSAVGRRKLMARVSPSKTVEGALGAAAASVAAALISKWTYAGFLGTGQAVSAGVLVAAACVVGDLVESMLKRSTGVKDSSGLIPGHGGLLDRFDSLLFAGPVFYVFARVALSGALR